MPLYYVKYQSKNAPVTAIVDAPDREKAVTQTIAAGPTGGTVEVTDVKEVPFGVTGPTGPVG